MFTDGDIVVVLRGGNERFPYVGSLDVIRLANFVYKVELVNGRTYLHCLKDRAELGKTLEVLEVID